MSAILPPQKGSISRPKCACAVRFVSSSACRLVQAFFGSIRVCFSHRTCAYTYMVVFSQLSRWGQRRVASPRPPLARQRHQLPPCALYRCESGREKAAVNRASITRTVCNSLGEWTHPMGGSKRNVGFCYCVFNFLPHDNFGRLYVEANSIFFERPRHALRKFILKDKGE